MLIAYHDNHSYLLKHSIAYLNIVSTVMIITIKLHCTIVFIVVETTLFPLFHFFIDILHQYN